MPENSLRSERLLLRAYVTDDFERVHLYGADPTFSQYEAWGPNTPDDTRKFVADMVAQQHETARYRFDFAACLSDSGLLVGGCGIRRESPGSVVASLGWAINPEFQGRGLATEAARRLIRFGFEELGLVVIYAICDARNAASARVAERAGLSLAGFIKGEKVVKGRVRDTLRFETVRSP